MTVYSKEEAMSWFLNNSCCILICQKEDGSTLECDNYPAAEEFFDRKEWSWVKS